MRVIRLWWAVLACTLVVLGGQAQDSNPSVEVPVVLEDDPELRAIDSMLVTTYLNHFCFTADTSILNIFDYPADSIPGVEAETIRERLASLNADTPFDLQYNADVDKTIRFYANKRRVMTARCLGMAQVYFPLFEQTLDKYDMPYELKYLAIVESALNPEARSRVGAVGLWQFMYATGKMYGLRITSYEDERMNPYKATDAACRFLTALYERYGDWNLALAAYNAGPGNVNKAIRRSGGKKDYWAIRPYLPRETRSYVPAFIAVNYIMNYASEHNIYPEEPEWSYFQCDTVHVNKQLHFEQVTDFTGVDRERLVFLNPSYKRGVIPENGRKHVLRLPVDAVATFVNNEDSIYTWRQDQIPEVEEEMWITYRVRSGDVLGKIAQRHGVRVSELKAWNNLRGNMIHPGQRLRILDKGVSGGSTSQSAPDLKPKPRKVTEDVGDFRYHTVQSGDTLWDIAKLYEGVDVEQIKQLNAGLDPGNLKQGQKIKVQKL